MKSPLLKTALAVLVVFALAGESKCDDSNGTRIPDSCTLGDVDFDGVSSTIADLSLFNSYFLCGMTVFIFNPTIQVGYTDFNCDGLVLSVADMVALVRILAGDLEPCYCMAGSTLTVFDQPMMRNDVSPYIVSIYDPPGGGFGRDTVEILLSGELPMTGYQFQLEYDTGGVSFMKAIPGDHFPDWNVFASTLDTIGDAARINVISTYAASSNPEADPDYTSPIEPTAIARLVFDISPDISVTKEIRFVWEDCSVNGISVHDSTAGPCPSPDFLALSNDVFDSNGDNITGSTAAYGGTQQHCLEAGVGGRPPQRAINFMSGRLEYTPSCCVGIRGDVNFDGANGDISDITCLVEYMFGEGCDVTCTVEADVNADNAVDVSDLTGLVAYIFTGGPAPASCF